MTWQKWDEDSIIQHLSGEFPSTNAIMGIGDDCAVIPPQQEEPWLITTDALVEGVHFLRNQIPPHDLGYKTVAVNVSDISAMGGEPQYAFLSIAFPKDIDAIWLQEFLQGIREACQKWKIQLLGGDTVGSKRDIFLNLTLTGRAAPNRIKYRHLAKTGDVICVSGYLGDSGGGFKTLANNLATSKAVVNLKTSHFHPEPVPAHGLWLAAHTGVHAMMDISDGLDCDLKKLLKSSKKGAAIDLENVPLSNSLTEVCLAQGWDIYELALTGGEDYCLLLTIAADEFDAIQDAFKSQFGQKLFPIGHITEGPVAAPLYRKQGEHIHTSYNNFDHFQ